MWPTCPGRVKKYSLLRNVKPNITPCSYSSKSKHCCSLSWQTIFLERLLHGNDTNQIIRLHRLTWLLYVCKNHFSVPWLLAISKLRNSLTSNEKTYIMFAVLYKINKVWYARKSICHGCSVRTKITISRDHCLASLGKASWCRTVTLDMEISFRTSQSWKILIILVCSV